MAKGNAKKARKRIKRLTAARRKVKVKGKTAKRKQAAAPPEPPSPRPPRDERRRQGAHYTPMWMAEDVVGKALYPHLLWMARDPEGWDRAHPPPKIRPLKPSGLAPGCFCDLATRQLQRDCLVHGVEATEAMHEKARYQHRLAQHELKGDEPTRHLLTALEAAVPLWIFEMRNWSDDARIELGHSLAQVVAEKGDILQFGSKRKGETAEVFNAAAKGLAALAYQPGGIYFCGVHWEAQRAA